MPKREAIRLKVGLRSGIQIVPDNAVLDADPDIAADLVGRGFAEYTDATERYPGLPFLDVVNEVPVTGAEKFPKPPDVEPVYPAGLIGTEADREAAREAKAGVAPAYDHPEKVGDELSPAKPAPADEAKGKAKK